MNDWKNLRTVAQVTAAFALTGLLAVTFDATWGAASTSSSSNDRWIDKRPVLTPASIEFGVYDPHRDYSDVAGIGIEHLFIPWEGLDAVLSDLAVIDRYAHARGRSLMLTVEPWSWQHPPESGRLLEEIVDGDFDSTIAGMCGAIGALQSPVMVRFAHEMEDTNGRFPWAGQEPETYKAAYRKFVLACRERAPEAEFIWSPKGNQGLAAYYPGDDVVDVVGLSIFGLEDYDIDNFSRAQTFAENLSPKYARVIGFGKPISIAELGYEGRRGYVEDWANSVTVKNESFPALQSVVYYNRKEVYPWLGDYGLPNWRVRRTAGE